MPSHDSSRPAVPLSLQLREATRQVHRRAERVAFIRSFLKGALDAAVYVELLASLARIYTALEEGLCGAADPALRELAPEAIRRAEPLRRDLADWRRLGFVPRRESPATERYCARLRELAASTPSLLAAHAYVRYLGDLAGGQLLGAVARRCLQPAPGEGLHFYAFEAIADVALFQQQYRQKLDRLADTPLLEQQLVAEAVEAFGLNIALFRELGQTGIFAAAVRLAARGRSRRHSR
jgi:heme oxygenase